MWRRSHCSPNIRPLSLVAAAPLAELSVARPAMEQQAADADLLELYLVRPRRRAARLHALELPLVSPQGASCSSAIKMPSSAPPCSSTAPELQRRRPSRCAPRCGRDARADGVVEPAPSSAVPRSWSAAACARVGARGGGWRRPADPSRARLVDYGALLASVAPASVAAPTSLAAADAPAAGAADWRCDAAAAPPAASRRRASRRRRRRGADASAGAGAGGGARRGPSGGRAAGGRRRQARSPHTTRRCSRGRPTTPRRRPPPRPQPSWAFDAAPPPTPPPPPRWRARWTSCSSAAASIRSRKKTPVCTVLAVRYLLRSS